MSAPAPQASNVVRLRPKSEAVWPNCIDCPGCTGMCRDLIDLLMIPDLVLAGRRTQ